MKIGAVSRMTRVSVRSIRHYHRIGVLREPPRDSGGNRVYSVADVAAVMRIRLLAESGVPLKIVPLVLDGGVDSPDHLGSVRTLLDARLAELSRQRDRLDILESRLADGGSVGFLPDPVDEALTACDRDAGTDERLRAVLRRERDLLDLMAMVGEFPTELSEYYSRVGGDAEMRGVYLEVLREFAEIEGRRPGDVRERITQLVETILAEGTITRLVTLGADRGGVEEGGPELDEIVPDPAQREVVRLILDRTGT